MTEIKVDNHDIGLICKKCDNLHILYQIRGKTVNLREESEGGVKLKWTCPKCNHEDTYLMADWKIIPKEEENK